ncbi:M23 family metallopeptidase [Pseudogemmatithrix spongiicola]|uniref:M23 family metallopeptidase n=1 Tax=Pseudogemmatithrix spongiicola TaxID=3062599 RepID=A0AA49JSR9_9BACT|nr:M23 family metallopeptidase [Gemmatimonadaceae bacterium 'strain 138']WKW14179.1 M23 family metallopeptidase [Gemmatimonadaceae bacterium 'strain 318']
MPNRRRWTIVFVPPRNEAARTFEVPGWTFRALKWTAACSVLLVAAAVFVLFSPWGTPGARLVAAQNRALQREIARVEQRFAELDDTLRQIAVREEQMRMLAGLPVESSNDARATVASADAGGQIVGPMSASVADVGGLTRRRPFAGRLGWSARPDVEGLISRASNLASGFRDVSDSLQANYQRFANTPSILPTAGWLSSQFTRSRFHPILHENRPHEGIDVTAPTGTPIVAPAAGKVVRAGMEGGFGLVVEIDHGNGILTKFAHCSRIAVRVGQQVTRNQLIAAVGSTGLSTAPHLHYEIHVNGKPVDPLTYVLPDAAP